MSKPVRLNEENIEKLKKIDKNINDAIEVLLSKNANGENTQPIPIPQTTTLTKEGTQEFEQIVRKVVSEEIGKLKEGIKKITDIALTQKRTDEPIIPGNMVKTTPMLGENDLCCECGTPATRISINKMTGTERKLCPICN